MDNTVIVALIAAAGTIISGILSAVIANKVMAVRIDNLEKTVNKHNNLIERVYKCEGDIKTLNSEISILQKGA